MRRIILMRHAQAEKNQDIRYGGSGSPLLIEAYPSLDRVIQLLKSFGIKKIISAPRLQCEQTAEYVASILAVEYYVDPLITPIYLGVIDGLSEQEISNNYPKVATIFKSWQNGEIDISNLKIPGIESPEVYCRKATSFLKRIIDARDSILVIATRSVLVCLGNLLLGNTPLPGGNYKEIIWRNNELMVFEIDGGTVHFKPELSTVQLTKEGKMNLRISQ